MSAASQWWSLGLGLVALLATASALVLALPGGCGTTSATDSTAAPPAGGPMPRRANRLAKTTSPYLLQHAHNPVDWYPWGAEAFEKARREQKPIFLSIGYSTCHWCHVMERESFEDEATAKLLNDLFVPIKVDREERPDVDQIYMEVTIGMSGHGGWPMSVFLTPERTPFFAGTYFPPEDRHGRPGFKTVLRHIADAWKNRRTELEGVGLGITEKLAPQAGSTGGEGPGPELLALAAAQLAGAFDESRGGFGGAPKFPVPHRLSFLLRRWKRTGDANLLRIVEATLDAMAAGGIHDHLGGGFHRYSTDADWFVPHFEKMLYDQALLARAYVEAFQATGAERHARVARGIFDYVLRDLRDPGGAFHSAEDADSEGEEGKFYVWTREAIVSVLGKEDGDLLADTYGADPLGNWVEEASGHRSGTNILHLPRPLAEIAKSRGLSPDALEARLAPAREKLLEVRSRRVRPLEDDKVLTAWNGLMVSALARAARALGEPRYADAARAAADFLLSKMRGDGRLLRSSRAAKPSDLPGYLDDHACLAEGLLDLYEATAETRYLAESLRLAREMLARFGGAPGGLLYYTASDGEALIVRPVELGDGATPAGNSVAALVFGRLARLAGDPALEAAADQVLRGASEALSRGPAEHATLLMALDFAREPGREIVLAGRPDDPGLVALRQAVDRRFLPDAVVAYRLGGPATAEVEALLPATKGQDPVDGKAAAYVCRDFACAAPVTTIGELERLLEAR